MGSGFKDIIPKVQAAKAKTSGSYIKLKCFCTVKKKTNSLEASLQNERKYLQVVHLIRMKE